MRNGQFQFTRIRQTFPRPQLGDIEKTVVQQLQPHRALIKPGASIAITGGSRGIANIARITKATVAFLHDFGAKPFIIPAMGSHGGATADGQRQLLASYGITEEAVDCPIRASMDVVELPSDGLETKVFMDRFAYESDGVILLNRIKPHTSFHGRFESGLVKMATIGLGKERQASEMHKFGVRGLRELMPEAGRRILASGKILLGIGIVENAFDETAFIEAIPATNIWTREPELLEIAKQNMPRLPIEDIDVLIVDRLGKNISGTGMDTNIIGRMQIRGEPEPESPRIKMIVVSDLTDESHGNATGIGFADVTTTRLRDRIDFAVTYKNVITSGFPDRAKLPIAVPSDREAFQIAVRAAGCDVTGRNRVIRIQDTLHVGELLVTQDVLQALDRKSGIEVVEEEIDLFDSAGQLCPFHGCSQK